MKKDERPPAPMGLVVEVDAVDLGVFTDALRLCCPLAGHCRAPCVTENSVPNIETPRTSGIHRWAGEWVGRRIACRPRGGRNGLAHREARICMDKVEPGL